MKYHTILWSDLAVISTGKNFVKKKKKKWKIFLFQISAFDNIVFGSFVIFTFLIT